MLLETRLHGPSCLFLGYSFNMQTSNRHLYHFTDHIVSLITGSFQAKFKENNIELSSSTNS